MSKKKFIKKISEYVSNADHYGIPINWVNHINNLLNIIYEQDQVILKYKKRITKINKIANKEIL